LLNRSFWKGRKVFLTGHTGFKGSWLSLWLDTLGAEVTGYALDPPTQPSLFIQTQVADTVHSVYGDIRDFHALQSAIESCRPEVVIHMAAQSVVRRGYEDPIETYSSNVMGTVHLLEALRQLGRPCAIVNVTSDKCYENREWIWGYRENEAFGGSDPYSNSKGCAELVTTAYRESYFPPAAVASHAVGLASARAGNVVGGGDWTANQLVPDLMRAFQAGRPCAIRNPKAIRPWQFVLEPLRGYLMLAERLSEDPGRFASGWNFGPAGGDAKPVSWMADELAALWGGGASWQLEDGAHPHESMLLRLDATKAEVHLGWTPRIRLQQTLEWTAEWYRLAQQKGDLRGHTCEQIERYELLCGDAAALPMAQTLQQ
jgi:CDP-glucose 4,6-dehydratase